MSNSLIVYTKEPERYPASDIVFSLDGANYTFSPRKDNRMMFLDGDIARRFMAAYPGIFTLWASYEGNTAPILPSCGKTGLDDVAVVITNHVTLEPTKAAYESFRKFYPTIQVYIVDNGSNDASTKYIEGLADENTTPILNPYNYGHGPATHQVAGIASAQGYKYLFALDSDTVTQRGGFIEAMLKALGDRYAVGKVYQTDENGFVNNSEQRGVSYVHPSAALYSLAQYRALRPFVLHGAPCIFNMIDAQLRGFAVMNFPIEDYVKHKGTVTVRAMKLQDVNAAYLFAQRPPLVSFVVRCGDAYPVELWGCIDSILNQTDADFEIVPIKDWGDLSKERPVITRVRGLYMYILDADSVLLDENFVATIRDVAKNNLNPDIIFVRVEGVTGTITPDDSGWGVPTDQLKYYHMVQRRELWMTCTINFGGRWYEHATIKDSLGRSDWVDFYWLNKVVVRVADGQ